MLQTVSFAESERITELKKTVSILLSGHFGNWEIFVRALCVMGYPLSVVMRRQKNGYINDLIERWRNTVGMEIIYTGGALKKSFAALKKNRIVCLLGDQDAKKKGVISTFFGQPSSTHVGAALLSYQTDKPVLVAFGYREKFKKYNSELIFMEIEALKAKAGGDRQLYVQMFVDEYNRLLEQMIRKHPDQYFWFHRRWKTKIDGKKIIDYKR